MPRYTDPELYSALRRVTEEIGRPPTANAYRDNRRDQEPTARTIINRHNDKPSPWMGALRRAGLQPNPAGHAGSSYHWHDRRRAINYIAAQLGAWPTKGEYQSYYQDNNLRGKYPAATTISRAEGSWESAVAKARGYYEVVERLVDKGPITQRDVKNETANELRRKGYIEKISVEPTSTYLLYLPAHNSDQVFEAWIGIVNPTERYSPREIVRRLDPIRQSFPDFDPIPRLRDCYGDDWYMDHDRSGNGPSNGL